MLTSGQFDMALKIKQKQETKHFEFIERTGN